MHGFSSKKRKRVVLTIEDKLKICLLVEQGEALREVAIWKVDCPRRSEEEGQTVILITGQ